MFCIVAVDKNHGIGHAGGLLIHLSGDLRYFKEQTLGKTVVMGYHTLLSLPHSAPLKGRRNIVLTSKDISIEGAEVCHSVDEVLELVKGEAPDSVAVIGGGLVYREMLPYCDRVLATEIEAIWDADTYFPELDGFSLVSRSEKQEENGIAYTFCVYERNR